MSEINPDLVEKYQLMLQSDPSSKVFAPLAEAYRKLGLLEEGIQLCTKGVQTHPDFAGGHVALGRLYLAKNQLELAARHLQRAVDLSPDNLLAQGLLGESYLRLKKPKDALKAYKMLLFLSPNDEKAQNSVRKLESLTADEFEEDVFSMEKLGATAARVNDLELEEPTPLKPSADTDDEERRKRDLERFLSLADAFIVRNDFERALKTLDNAEKVHGPAPDVIKRIKLINQRFTDDDWPQPGQRPPSRADQQLQAKEALLRELQRRIQVNRRNS